jgi:hypothetical protein
MPKRPQYKDHFERNATEPTYKDRYEGNTAAASWNNDWKTKTFKEEKSNVTIMKSKARRKPVICSGTGRRDVTIARLCGDYPCGNFSDTSS